MIRSSLIAPLLALASLLAATQAAAQRAPGAADAATAAQGDASATPVAIGGGGGGLVVGGIEVDVGGKTAIDARLNGWREAQRLAWPALWARLSGKPAQTAPRLADSALDGIVSAIEVEREQIGPTRYVARLAVVFDRVRASSYLGRFASLSTSPPFLLLPVLQDAATRQAHEPDSPWLAAWARLRAGESPIDYVRIQPTPGDTVLLNAWQSERQHLFLWRALIDRYQVADVLIPELILDRSFVGGPVSGLLIVRFGTSGRELGRVRLNNRAGDIAALVDAAVRAADRIYVTALRAGNLLPDPDLLLPDVPLAELEDSGPELGGDFIALEAAGLRVRVATPDDATLQAIQRIVAGTAGVGGVRVQSFVLGGESVLEIQSLVSVAELRQALDARGLRLDGNLLRRRAAGEAPIPPIAPEAVGDPPIEGPTDAGAAPKSVLPGGG